MLLKPFYCIYSLLFLLFVANADLQPHRHRTKRYDFTQLTHEPRLLDDSKVQFLSSDNFESPDLFEKILDAILIPRSPGTDGHQKVQKYIIKAMESLHWNVSEDTFDANTPLGKRTFSNLVATLQPNHCQRLVLACHYDSKLNREKTFLGATDSAVPCAMMLHLAHVLDPLLKKSKSETTLQLVFFDGEEAFVQWSNEDSLYGSRHLAAKWSRAPFPKQMRATCKNQTQTRELDRVQLLVLLDLIGASSPKFYNYFPNTRPLFGRLVDIEKKMNELDLLEKNRRGKKSAYFSARQSFSYIEDDHVPFLRRNVPILHVIATPFPTVWHRETDNKENLDFASIRNLQKILRVFVSEYLHLEV